MIVYDIFLDIPGPLTANSSPEKIPPELLAVGLQHALLHACVASQWGVDAGKSVEFLQAVSGFVSSYKNCL